jgi:hypothetical protein
LHPLKNDTFARRTDILVWRDLDGIPFHSAIVREARVDPASGRLSYSSTVATKNGIEPEAIMNLGQLIEDYYGESYHVYRRRGTEGELNA